MVVFKKEGVQCCILKSYCINGVFICHCSTFLSRAVLSTPNVTKDKIRGSGKLLICLLVHNITPQRKGKLTFINTQCTMFVPMAAIRKL